MVPEFVEQLLGAHLRIFNRAPPPLGAFMLFPGILDGQDPINPTKPKLEHTQMLQGMAESFKPDLGMDILLDRHD